ncbi:MAG: type IV pili twitching motility protein PilT [Deltaproteobacteria bacterium]|nr:type IV pilus twitching motility protein PilT [Deltaproteobacteria bacterium]RLA91772.1 MAG: type IV pili twitching motility protein PilT [Deltaproteobacteria bacterium]
MDINEILLTALNKFASDIHLKVGLPPILRIHGNLVPLKTLPPLDNKTISDFAMQLTNDLQREKLKKFKEVDLGYGVSGLGRFRVNIFQQRGTLAIALRVIPVGIKSIEELHLPKIIEKLSLEQRGLILCTGVTGSGKSTTLAAMVDYINNHRKCHVITIEDPIEYLHKDKMSMINQREIGFDTLSFASALKSALRQDPDVILVGEMRDFETIETALVAAETGHLVLSTLHTLDAVESINRIISVFPPYQHKQVRLQLAGVLKGVISQRLVPRGDGIGRVPAVEIMVSTARVRECIIEKEKTREIYDAISKGYVSYGMQSFDQSLMQLLSNNLITYEEALRQSSNPDDFALRVKGILSTSDISFEDFMAKTIEDEEGETIEKDDKIDRF